VTSQCSAERPEEQPSDTLDPAICKRPGCGNPLPVSTRGRGRSRQFCSNECARRYHNDARIPRPRTTEPPDSRDPLTALDALIRQAAVFLRAAREQAASMEAAQVRAHLAESEAARLRAEASAAAAATRAAKAQDQVQALTEALAAARAEVRAVNAELVKCRGEPDTPTS
jgi:hypothetical protein